MDDHWFFKTLWRLNALLIAGGALNIGIHTPATNQTYWIFPTNKQLITYVDQDTDQNDNLSAADNKSLLSIRSDGRSQNLLMQNLKNTPATIHSDPNAQDILILLRDDTGLQFHQFNPTTFTLALQQSIQLP